MSDNISFTVLPAVARTATPVIPDQRNRGCTTGAFILNVATAPSGQSLTFGLKGLDKEMENYNTINGTSYPTSWWVLEGDPISTPGIYIYRVLPQAVPVSGLVVQDFVPYWFTLAVTHSNAGSSWLYSLAYQLGE